MALRVSDLPLDFASALLEVTTVLEDTQITYFCNILWCIWKARNQEIFSSKKATRQRILKQAQMMEMHIQQTTESSQTTIRSRVNIAAPLSGTQIVLLDASWDTNRKAGWGAVYYNHRGNINRVQYGFMGAEDPFHAESMALLNVLQNCQSHRLVQRGGTMHIFSDCKTMVRAIQCNELGDLPSWRATETIAQCIQILQQWGELCLLRYITRHALSDPHKLANMARRNVMEFDGNPWQGDRMGITLTSCLDEEWFQISH